MMQNMVLAPKGKLTRDVRKGGNGLIGKTI
jgi:hypothetical protein